MFLDSNLRYSVPIIHPTLLLLELSFKDKIIFKNTIQQQLYFLNSKPYKYN